jgi:hypothetical protein
MLRRFRALARFLLAQDELRTYALYTHLPFASLACMLLSVPMHL